MCDMQDSVNILFHIVWGWNGEMQKKQKKKIKIQNTGQLKKFISNHDKYIFSHSVRGGISWKTRI